MRFVRGQSIRQRSPGTGTHNGILAVSPRMVSFFELSANQESCGRTRRNIGSHLGHELEHVDHYHCAERVQMEARLRNLKLGIVGALVQIPLEVWQAGYSKDEELEADREGLRLAVLGGYSSYGAVSLFEKFNELHAEHMIHAKSPEQELSELAIQSLEGYFRSHPVTSERLTQAE